MSTRPTMTRDLGDRSDIGDVPVTVDPDQVFLGCLLRCPLPVARRLLAGMRPDDVQQPVADVALAAVIRLVARDVAPEPALVLAEARDAGWLDTGHKHTRLADWLISTYRFGCAPEAGGVVKAAVLEQALRRELHDQAVRVKTVAAHVEIDRLHEIATFDTDRISDLRQRRSVAVQPDAPTGRDSAATGDLSASRDAPGAPELSDYGKHVLTRSVAADSERSAA